MAKRDVNQIHTLTKIVKRKDISNVGRLIVISRICKEFHCGVWCWKGYGPTEHSDPNSLHNKKFSGSNVGRAFDVYIGQPKSYLKRVSGDNKARGELALYLQHHFTPYLTEGIYNAGKYSISIKNGKKVSSNHWTTSTWKQHNNHIHIAI